MASRAEYLNFVLYLSMCVFSCLEGTRSMDILVNGSHRNLTLKEKFEVNFYFLNDIMDARNITVYVRHRHPGANVFNSKCILKYSRENCTSTTTLCCCTRPSLANYSLSKVFTRDDAGTWVVILWKAQNQVQETINIIIEENTKEPTLSTAVISIVSFISVVAVVSMSMLFLWCWSKFFVKTVILIVMASADTPSNHIHRKSTSGLRKSRDIYNISSKTLPVAALPKSTTALHNPVTTFEPARALLEPAAALQEPTIALPGPARKLPEPEVALPESALPSPSQALPKSPTALPGPATALLEPATAFPVTPLSLSALTAQSSPPARAHPREHAALPPRPAPLLTATLPPKALAKVPPPTPPKPPLPESASAQKSLRPPTLALLPKALPKVPPATPPKPPLATTSTESAPTSQALPLPTPEPSPA